MLTAFLMVCMILGASTGQGTFPMPAAAVQALGIGYPSPKLPGAQGRLMAQRAAEVVAARNLAVKLGVGPRGRLPSFRYVSTKNLPNGAIEVTVETMLPVRRNTTVSPTTKYGLCPQRQVGGRP